jgi:hypothetical protein
LEGQKTEYRRQNTEIRSQESAESKEKAAEWGDSGGSRLRLASPLVTPYHPPIPSKKTVPLLKIPPGKQNPERRETQETWKRDGFLAELD